MVMDVGLIPSAFNPIGGEGTRKENQVTNIHVGFFHYVMQGIYNKYINP